MKINMFFLRRKCFFLIKSFMRVFCLIVIICFNVKYGCINILLVENCVGNDMNGKLFCFFKKIYILLKMFFFVI